MDNDKLDRCNKLKDAITKGTKYIENLQRARKYLNSDKCCVVLNVSEHPNSRKVSVELSTILNDGQLEFIMSGLEAVANKELMTIVEDYENL